MTNREKFKEIWGHDKPEELTSEWWNWNFVDITTKCCNNCSRHNGTVLENIACETQHGIHDPRYQACIAFEKFGRRNVDD